MGQARLRQGYRARRLWGRWAGIFVLPALLALLAGCGLPGAGQAAEGRDPVAGLALDLADADALALAPASPDEADTPAAPPEAAGWSLAALLRLPGAALEDEPLPAELEGLELGEDLLAFRAQLGEQAVAFPCGVSTLAALGWQMHAEGEEWFMPGEWAEVVFESAGGTLRGTVENTGDEGCFISDCAVTGFSVDAANTAPVALPGGVGLGTARAALLQSGGTPHSAENDPGAAQTAQVLTWSAGADAFVSLYMAGDAVGGITLYCRAAPGAAAAEPAPPAAQLPAGWQPPAALSDDWKDYTLEYGGDLYTLPAPVAAFLANGWALRDTATVPAGQWLRGVSLTRDGMVLRTMVSNTADTDQPLENCWVNMVEYRQHNGAAQPMKLAGGLDENSTAEQLVEAWGPPDIRDTTGSTSRAYTYFSDHGRVVFTFRRDNGQIAVLEAWNRPEAPG